MPADQSSAASSARSNSVSRYLISDPSPVSFGPVPRSARSLVRAGLPTEPPSARSTPFGDIALYSVHTSSTGHPVFAAPQQAPYYCSIDGDCRSNQPRCSSAAVFTAEILPGTGTTGGIQNSRANANISLRFAANAAAARSCGFQPADICGLCRDSAFQVVFLDFAIQGPFADLQHASGFFTVSVGQFQCAFDVVFFDFRQRTANQ